jgi:hypothetical protein
VDILAHGLLTYGSDNYFATYKDSNNDFTILKTSTTSSSTSFSRKQPTNTNIAESIGFSIIFNRPIGTTPDGIIIASLVKYNNETSARGMYLSYV